MTVEQLLEAAYEQTGLKDLGPDTWRPGLELLSEGLDDPLVSRDGGDRIRGELVAALVNRLRVVEYLALHPALERESIDRPLFIIGMPRTGTTLASYLLDRDPGRRSLLNWEAGESVPPPTTEALRTDNRCTTKLEGQREILGMGIHPPHWEWADGPTECMMGIDEDDIPLTADLKARNPIPRWGYPEDVEGIAAYLASDSSRYHTGDVIIIDGGASVGL